MGSETSTGKQDDVLFQCEYGPFQKKYRWAFSSVAILGLICVPIGLFGNEGWEFGGQPLAPWVATIVIELLAIGALLTALLPWILKWQHDKSPRHVTLRATTLTVPKGVFSSGDRIVQLEGANIKLLDAGFVRQIQIKKRRQKILLASARFVDNADFDRLAEHLLGEEA